MTRMIQSSSTKKRSSGSALKFFFSFGRSVARSLREHFTAHQTQAMLIANAIGLHRPITMLRAAMTSGPIQYPITLTS